MLFEHLRNRDIPSYLSVDEVDPYALIFVVNDNRDEFGNTSSESDILQASTLALVNVLLSDNVDTQKKLDAWLSGRIRKIAKRAKNSAWEKTDSSDLVHYDGEYGSAKVRVYAPMRISEQPPFLKKLQVTGLQAEDTGSVLDKITPYLQVDVNASLDMSTGKLVAQVGHAVQLFIMRAEVKQVHDWLYSGSMVYVQKLDVLDEVNASVAVHDAGFTEVVSGSLTCVANFVEG